MANFLQFSKIYPIFARRMRAKSGATLAIEASFIALGSHSFYPNLE